MEKSCYKFHIHFLQFTKKAQKAIFWSRIQTFFVNDARFVRKHVRAYSKLAGTPSKTRVALSMRPKYPRWSKWIISLDTDSTIQDLELFNYIVKKTWVSQKMVVLENCNFKKSGFVVRFLRVFSYNTMMIYRVFQPTCFFLLFMPFWALLDHFRWIWTILNEFRTIFN